VQVEMTAHDRAEAASNWRNSMAALYERRTGPRKVAVPDGVAPYSTWNPVLPGHVLQPERSRFVRSNADAKKLPANDDQIALASV